MYLIECKDQHDPIQVFDSWVCKRCGKRATLTYDFTEVREGVVEGKPNGIVEGWVDPFYFVACFAWPRAWDKIKSFLKLR